MCGIIGQLNFDGRPVDRELFDAMRDTLRHRGPDGAGTELLENGSLALGHRRLSILDLSERGRQPMTNEDGQIWITFNGEIYNFRPLRKQLTKAGHRFRSASDTEVLVHGYEEWGMDGLLERIKGMFAFGLWDGRRRKLYVARDRFGIKPLVYYRDGNRFTFASEIKACTRDRALKPKMRIDALADYFLYSYVPHRETIWEGVCKLPPAHYLEIDANTAESREVRYWRPSAHRINMGYAEALERTDELLARAVNDHLVSDVPVGLFLSGGYDSAAALMYMRRAGVEVDAFSLGFSGSEHSEHRPAATIAEKLGARHHVKLLEYEDELFPLMERLVRHYDEPFAVTSQLTYHHVSELAARTHKVVLAGDGGDEIFAGYTWYGDMVDWRPGPRSLLRAARGRGSLREQKIEAYARRQTGVFFNIRGRDFLSPDLLDRMESRAFQYFETNYDPALAGDEVKAVQRMDLATFMLDNCLRRADLSSMLHSLEVRVPFLDHELFEFVYSLPTKLYFDRKRKKKLLHEQLQKELPASLLERRKQGFGFQHVNALQGPAYADFVNNGEMRKQGLLRGPVDFSRISGEEAFHLTFLEQWFRIN